MTYTQLEYQMITHVYPVVKEDKHKLFILHVFI